MDIPRINLLEELARPCLRAISINTMLLEKPISNLGSAYVVASGSAFHGRHALLKFLLPKSIKKLAVSFVHASLNAEHNVSHILAKIIQCTLNDSLFLNPAIKIKPFHSL